MWCHVSFKGCTAGTVPSKLSKPLLATNTLPLAKYRVKWHTNSPLGRVIYRKLPFWEWCHVTPNCAWMSFSRHPDLGLSVGFLDYYQNPYIGVNRFQKEWYSTPTDHRLDTWQNDNMYITSGLLNGPTWGSPSILNVMLVVHQVSEDENFEPGE